MPVCGFLSGSCVLSAGGGILLFFVCWRVWAGYSEKIYTKFFKTGGNNINTLNIKDAEDITLYYLCKIHGEQEGLQLFLQDKSRLFAYHGLAWRLGKECLPYFCEIFLHNPLFDYSGDNIPLSKTHFEIWDELQDLMLNKNNTRNVYVLPRGFGKSTTITLVMAMWSALYCIHPFTVIQSATEAQAQGFINSIKIRLEDNEYIKNCFGDIINKDLKYNASEIELDIKPQRTKIQAVSSTQSVRGINYGTFRIGLLLVDDGQDEKQVVTPEACAAFVSRFNGGIMKALQSKNNHVIAVGTVIRRGDLYDELLNSAAWTSQIKKCALVDDISEFFNNNKHWQKVKSILYSKRTNPNAAFDAEAYYIKHKKKMDFPLIWDVYNCYDLFKEWLDDTVTFKRERQCDINSLGEKQIHHLKDIPADEIERECFIKTILSVDPASTTGKKSDYSAFCVLSQAESGIYFARKCLIKKLKFEDYINQIIDLLVKYTDINTISIERQTYNGADVIRLKELILKHPELQQRTFTILNKARSKNKESRISALCVPTINSEQIIFNSDDADAITQIKSYCGVGLGSSTHDDMIDAVADAMENISQVTNGGTYSFISFSDVGYF